MEERTSDFPLDGNIHKTSSGQVAQNIKVVDVVLIHSEKRRES